MIATGDVEGAQGVGGVALSLGRLLEERGARLLRYSMDLPRDRLVVLGLNSKQR